MIRALLAEIAFFEALFKSHYTKGFRLSYLIPLPTSVAGIFGAMLGIPRTHVGIEFSDIRFGAVIKAHKGIISENITFLQAKPGNPVKGVARTFIINEPNYIIAMAGNVDKLSKYKKSLEKKIEYMPYGGQNDFFPRDFHIIKDLAEVEDSKLVGNYAPSEWVKSVESNETAELQILPVMHKFSTSRNFHFVFNGKLHLKKSIPCVKDSNIGLYSVEDFYLVGGSEDD